MGKNNFRETIHPLLNVECHLQILTISSKIGYILRQHGYPQAGMQWNQIWLQLLPHQHMRPEPWDILKTQMIDR